MLLQLGVTSFNTVLHTAKVGFYTRLSCSTGAVVNALSVMIIIIMRDSVPRYCDVGQLRPSLLQNHRYITPELVSRSPFIAWRRDGVRSFQLSGVV